MANFVTMKMKKLSLNLSIHHSRTVWSKSLLTQSVLLQSMRYVTVYW